MTQDTDNVYSLTIFQMQTICIFFIYVTAKNKNNVQNLHQRI